MKKISLVLIAFFMLLFGGALAFLAMWEIPAPSAPVQKVLNNDRFPR